MSLIRIRFSLLALCALLLVPTTFAQDKVFNSLNDLNSASFWGDRPEITRWLKDGNRYLQPRDGKLMAVDARTDAATPFHDPAKMEAALKAAGMEAGAAAQVSQQSNFNFSDDETKALIARGDALYIYDFSAGKAVKVAEAPNKREVGFSPDGRSIAFVRDNNLYAASVDAPGVIRQLTRDGSESILNGRLDWVYEEEVYGRGKTQGYAWSPDGKNIAFLRIDDQPVKPFPIIDNLPALQNIERQVYPRAGDPNPIVTLGVVAADGKTAPRFMDVSGYPDANRLIVRFAWHPDGKRLTFQVQNRIQTVLELLIADASTGKTTRLLQEKTPAWVEIIDNPRWLKDGTFLWLSDRTGYRHLYRYRADGTLNATITAGNWDIRKLYGVDSAEQNVYFSGTQRSWLQQDVYRVAMSGGKPQRLTTSDFDHEANFSPSCAYFVDNQSDAFTPPQYRMRSGTDGAEIRLLESNDGVKKSYGEWKFSKPEFVQIKGRDGSLLQAKILKPTDIEPGKKYPVWMKVYGGPGATTVENSWRPGNMDQLMAQKGYVVVTCDTRLGSAQGAKSAWSAYKNLFAGELADYEDTITYLKSLPYVDGARVGITGWSYGGSIVAYALTHSKSFKIGIAGAPVTDWRNYDSIYTERYMDTPQNNPSGYAAATSTGAAADLTGRLLILHGMMDDNVHFQNSVQLVYALQRAGKRNFEFMPYPAPTSRHGIGDPRQSRHLRDLEWEFIQKNL